MMPLPLPPPRFRPQLLGHMPVRTPGLDSLCIKLCLSQAYTTSLGCWGAGRLRKAPRPRWSKLPATARACAGVSARLSATVPARAGRSELPSAAAAIRSGAAAARAVLASAAGVHAAADHAEHILLRSAVSSTAASGCERWWRAVRCSGQAVCCAGSQPDDLRAASGHVCGGHEKGSAGYTGWHEGARLLCRVGVRLQYARAMHDALLFAPCHGACELPEHTCMHACMLTQLASVFMPCYLVNKRTCAA